MDGIVQDVVVLVTVQLFVVMVSAVVMNQMQHVQMIAL
jgi:hypothetical protein